MKKKIALIGSIIAYTLVFSQQGNVGINTATPQRTLHVNGAVQLTNELNVGGDSKTAGNAGTSGQILSSQGSNQAPVWIDGNSLKAIQYGQLNNSSITIDSYRNIGSQIQLSKGKWVIYFGQLLNSNSPGTQSNNMWTRITFSSSNTQVSQTNGFSFLFTKFISGWLGISQLSGNKSFSFLSGVIPVEVTSDSVTLYSWTGLCDKIGNVPTTTVQNNRENYLFAVPSN